MQMNWSFIYAPLAWEVSLRKPDYWRAVCYGALTKSNWSACKCEVIQLSHFPSPLQASSWHLPRPRYEYKWRTQAWVLSPFLPTNNSNLHPGAKWTSMRTFQSPRPRSVPPYLPSSHSAGPGEHICQWLPLGGQTQGRGPSRTCHLPRMDLGWGADFRADMSPWLYRIWKEQHEIYLLINMLWGRMVAKVIAFCSKRFHCYYPLWKGVVTE